MKKMILPVLAVSLILMGSGCNLVTKQTEDLKDNTVVEKQNKDKDKTIEWLNYTNEEYHFTLSYPSLSVNNILWVYTPEQLTPFEVLLPNQVLSKNNNFYLNQEYTVSINLDTGEYKKTENTFIPEYDGVPKYPLPWHIVILEAKNEQELDEVIKQKLGSGCSYKDKIATDFDNNYRIEIDGDGKDLGSTNCPVNYANFIIYNPTQNKVAFWGMGQECQIGLGFGYDNCFDLNIANSFHFIN